MSANSNLSISKILIYLILTIWTTGSLIITTTDELKVRKECIKNKGYMVGILFCDNFKNSYSNFELTLRLIKNLNWPLYLIINNANASIARSDIPDECFYDYEIRSEKCRPFQELFFKLVKDNSIKGDLDSQKLLAKFYAYGYGTKKNMKLAYETIKIASASGDADTLFSLGWHYENGIGVQSNQQLAIDSYFEAALKEHDKAQYNLANIYLNLKKPNYKEAFKWFNSSARLGNSAALNNLGIMYYNGYGISKNYIIALAYFYAARKKDNKDSYNNVAKLENLLGKSDRDKSLNYADKILSISK